MTAESTPRTDSLIARALVLLAGGGLLACWAVAYGPSVAGGDALARFIVCAGVAFVLLLRKRDAPVIDANLPFLLRLAVAGVIVSAIGILLAVHQCTWIGMLLMLYACLRWGLPRSIAPNAMITCFMLYWAHPLPSQIEWPLHAVMQQLSVAGSEWLLQVLSVPAWAEGTIIHGVSGTFEVPRACSGMRTASTAVVCAAGAAVLFRLGWKRAVALSLLGVSQTLLLNIVRITVMVANVSLATSSTSADFLHDTTGGLLLVSILLVYGEAALWHWTFVAEAQSRSHGVPYLGVLPLASGLVAVMLVGGIIVGSVKRDGEHQAIMVGRVAKALIVKAPTTADRASREALRLDEDAPGGRLIRARLLRGQDEPEAVLAVLEALPDDEDMGILALRLWALNALGRTEDVRQRFEALPPHVIAHPEVALVAAQLAASHDVLADVLQHLPQAAASRQLADRVRRFYPYLAAREQWHPITEIDSTAPYTDAEELLLGVTAHLIVDDSKTASSILRNNRAIWESDPQFAGHLLVLAEREPSREWGVYYAACVRPHVARMDADTLYTHIKPLFLLRQDALAIEVYAHLKACDPQHPGVSLAAARHTEHLAAGEGRSALLNQALVAYEERHGAGTLSRALTLDYADALAMAEKTAQASRVLDTLQEEGSAIRNDVLSRQVILYRQAGEWQKAYEAIRDVRSTGLFPDRLTVNELVDVLAGMGESFYALTVAELALEKTPGWPGIRRSAAMLLASFGHHEEALFVLSQGKLPLSVGHIRLYESTARFRKAYAGRQQLGMPELTVDSNPSWLLPPAETTVMPPTVAEASPVSDTKRLSQLRQQIASDSSPFFMRLNRLRLNWISGGDSDAPAPIEDWTAVGRDPVERSVALHALALLQLQAGKLSAAANTVERALQETPHSSVLWRLAVALSSGESDLVERAHLACPANSDLWLATLVAAQRSGATEDQLSRVLDEACEASRYAPGTLIRAAGFLLQSQSPNLAERAVQQALRQDATYVPAYLVGIHSSRLCDDLSAAVKRASVAAELAPNPWPFYRTAVMLQMARNANDPSVVPKLEALRTQFPNEQEWHIRLGCIYMEHEDAERAWRVLEPVVGDGRDSLPSTVITRAAEAARLNGRHDVAIALLRGQYESDSTDLHVLNNLVFTLAQQESGKEEAASLVPDLLKLGSDAGTLDTAAFALNTAGKPSEALPHIERALQAVAADPIRFWTGIYITAAEIHVALGQRAEAKALIERLIEGTGPVIQNEPRVRKLLSTLD